MNAVPKPLLVLMTVAVVAAAAWFLWPSRAADPWLGYVEAETIYVAAPISGRLAERPLDRGASVTAGAPLFSLDPESTDADTARVEAQIVAARAQAGDLGQARERAPELAVSQAAVAQAAAQLAKAQNDFSRISALAARGFASRAQLDAARAARDAAAAAVAQGRAQIASGELSAGRSDQIAAARAQVSEAEAALRAQRQRRREIAPTAPEAGVIEQTYYNVGEWVPANSPVVAVLPDARRKLRFYVPQDRIATLRPGSAIRYSCDGCGTGGTAQVSFIAPRAEYTPPVIYSENARAKLVFLVEALLPPSRQPLPPGLPVEVVPQ